MGWGQRCRFSPQSSSGIGSIQLLPSKAPGGDNGAPLCGRTPGDPWSLRGSIDCKLIGLPSVSPAAVGHQELQQEKEKK